MNYRGLEEISAGNLDWRDIKSGYWDIKPGYREGHKASVEGTYSQVTGT